MANIQLKMEDADTIEVVFQKPDICDNRPITKDPLIQITVGGNRQPFTDVSYKLLTTKTFDRMMRSYREMIGGLRPGELRFLYCGLRIAPTETPKEEGYFLASLIIPC